MSNNTEEQMREALPCPFCGSYNISEGEVLSSHPNGKVTTQSMCVECGALGPEGVLLNDEVDYGDVKATEAWNRRGYKHSAITEDRDVRIKELELEVTVAMQAEVLKKARIALHRELYLPVHPLQEEIESAISATAETVQAFRDKLTEPLRREVSMLVANITELIEFPNNYPYRVKCAKAIADTKSTAQAYEQEVEARGAVKGGYEAAARYLNNCKYTRDIHDMARIIAGGDKNWQELRATSKKG